MPGLDQLPRLVDVELHAVEFAQQVVGKLDVGLVDLVDQDHRRRIAVESFPQDTLDDVIGDVGHPGITQLRVAQTGDGIVLIQALLCLGRRLDMPLEKRQPERASHFLGKHGLAGARLTLDQQRALQGDGGIDGERQIARGDVLF